MSGVYDNALMAFSAMFIMPAYLASFENIFLPRVLPARHNTLLIAFHS